MIKPNKTPLSEPINYPLIGPEFGLNPIKCNQKSQLWICRRAETLGSFRGPTSELYLKVISKSERDLRACLANKTQHLNLNTPSVWMHRHETDENRYGQFLRWWSSAVLISFRCLSVCELTAEPVSECIQQVRYGFLHADFSLQLSAQRRHSFAFDTTRHDVAEPRHVGVTVQSQAVRRDVAPTVDS